MSDQQTEQALRYELRIQFNDPAAMGVGMDVAINALLAAEIPMRTTGHDFGAVKVEDGEYVARELTADEEAAFEAGQQEGVSSFGGTLEVSDPEKDDGRRGEEPHRLPFRRRRPV
jgi:hypothetical protein